MSKLRSVAQTLSLGLIWTAIAGAQTPPRTSPATSAPAAAATPDASASISAEPRLPELNDPMLKPPPPAAHVLNTWQEALALVRRDQSTLAAARARIEQARAQERLALAPALPSLVGSGRVTDQLLRHPLPAPYVNPTNGQTISELPYPPYSASAALDLSVPLLAARAWYDRKTAREATDAAILDSKEVERQQVALVAGAIVDVVTNERLAEVSRVSLGSALSTLDLTKRRAALGASSTVDVLRVEQEASLSRAQVVSADENLMRAREALGDALGSPEAWSVTQDIRIDALAADANASCVQAANIELRTDVASALQNVRVAERNVKSIDYSYVPTIAATSNLTYYSNIAASPNVEHLAWRVDGVLTWQIYDGTRYGNYDARRADVEVARQRVSEVKRRALIQVAQATRGVTVAQANLTVAERSRYLASETARLTKVAYLNGTGTSFDLVDSERKLREAEIDLTIKEFQVVRAKIAALLALATCHV
jgi:multidrug efflux system outer membrane protein